MAKDLSKLDAGAPASSLGPVTLPQSEEDYIVLVSTWVKALGRKAEVEDIQREPAAFRAILVKGAQIYLARYKGDFEFLLEVRGRLTKIKNHKRVLEYPSIGQAKGILNCLRSELYRQPGSYSGPPIQPGLPGQGQPIQGQPAPAQAGPARLKVEDAGVYVLPDGTVCKVQANKEKTRTYAKRWVEISGSRLVETGAHRHGEYEYVAGLVEQVAQEGRKMSLEEAKAHSVLYGRCVRCGRSLKDAKSVEQGMGPVCITYFGGGA